MSGTCHERTLAVQPLMTELDGELPVRNVAPCSLFVERPTPSARTYANHAGEDMGQVTLISKAAGRAHIRERQSPIAQFLLGHLDAAREQPLVR
jgi:hypothetical protein